MSSFEEFLIVYLAIGTFLGIAISVLVYTKDGIRADAGRLGMIVILAWPMLAIVGIATVFCELLGWVAKTIATTIVPLVTLFLNRLFK